MDILNKNLIHPGAIVWKSKLRAFALHFMLTAAIAVTAAFLVFYFWFPAPFSSMLGGTTLFLLVVVCDLILGPVLSLVIYHPEKSRKALLSDYSVVIAIQVAALIYGFFMVAQARPLFLVFTVDRYVVVNYGDLPSDELNKIPNQSLRPKIFSSYESVYVEKISDPTKNFDLVLSALGGGKDLQHITENYQSISDHIPEILKNAHPLEILREKFSKKTADINNAILKTGLPLDNLRWLPVQAQKNSETVFWTAIIDTRTALPVGWLNLDPL